MDRPRKDQLASHYKENHEARKSTTPPVEEMNDSQRLAMVIVITVGVVLLAVIAALTGIRLHLASKKLQISKQSSTGSETDVKLGCELQLNSVESCSSGYQTTANPNNEYAELDDVYQFLELPRIKGPPTPRLGERLKISRISFRYAITPPLPRSAASQSTHPDYYGGASDISEQAPPSDLGYMEFLEDDAQMGDCKVIAL
ncbi:uncharacterized protein [Watersipora subatra]|uniref:uncharacterized protein n=1 Tax=Watersipora subatra TaxID=2589382 RepID=UPI00355AF17A